MNRLSIITVVVLALSVSCMRADDRTNYMNSYNFIKGMECVESGDYQEAIDFFKQELEVNPKNGYAYCLMAETYNDIEEYGQALENADAAIKLLSKDKEWKVRALRNRAEIHSLVNEDELALQDYAQAIKADPKRYEAYGDRANFYYLRHEYDKSDADWEKVIQLQPNNCYGYGGKACNMLARGKYEEGIALMDHAIRLYPNFQINYVVRADCYLHLNKYVEAAEDLISAMGIKYTVEVDDLLPRFKGNGMDILITKLKAKANEEKNEPAWLFLIGYVYDMHNMYHQAITYYKKSCELEEHDNSLYGISRCYYDLGNYTLAKEYNERCLALDSEDPSYLMLKSCLLYEEGKADDAITCLDKLIEIEPDYYGGYYKRGFVKDNLQDADGAIEDYSMAIALNPDDAYSYLGRGDMYSLKHEDEKALADYRKVVEIDTLYTDNACAQYAWQQLGQKDKAVEFMDSILANNADDPGCYYDAACLYARAGDTKMSLSYIRQSLEKGYRRFAHIENDNDLKPLRNLSEFKALMAKYREIYRQENMQATGGKNPNSELSEKVCFIPFTKDGGGTLTVPCTINGLPLHFCFDTGCSDVSMSQVEATFMLKNGFLSKDDIVGKQRFSDALGNVSEGTVIILKNVKFGDLTLKNVRASVVKNQIAPLLLGQSVLNRAGKVEIDYDNKQLIMKYRK